MNYKKMKVNYQTNIFCKKNKNKNKNKNIIQKCPKKNLKKQKAVN